LRLERPEALPIYRSPRTVERFEVPVTFRVPPRTEAVLRVVTLVVERFEDPETFREFRTPKLVMLGWAG
jgi:hypothetical protein